MAVVASLDQPARLLAEQRRELLALEMEPIFKRLQQDFALHQFQFHLPPATSFLRAHQVDRYGDDLSSFRQTVVDANRNQRVVQGLERGVAGLGIRGISPVQVDNRHIGTVEFGMSFGQPFFDQFKAKYGAEIALYLPEKGSFTPFGRTLDTTLLESEQLQAALEQPLLLQREHAGQQLALYARPIMDYNGKAVGVLELAIDRTPSAAAMNWMRNKTLGIGLVALVFGLSLAWLVGRSFLLPLREASTAMAEIASGDGDLTRRLPEDGQDEISELAGSFNQFAEKVRLLVAQVAEATTQLAAAAEETAAVSEQSSQGVIHQQEEVQQVATAMNQLAMTARQIAEHADQAAGAASNADQEAAQGRQVVMESMDAIDGLARTVQEAVEVIQQLDREAESIGDVTEVIRAVAEQTNLLALNAAIEAARAGEQGRGFAVVADEVRTLASRTQSSTQQIGEVVERLQTAAKQAAAVMAAGGANVEHTVGQAALAAEALQGITRAVATINDMNTHIASAAEEQSATTEAMNRNLTGIQGNVEQSAAASEQTSAASGELARLAAALQGIVGQFRV